MSDLGALRVSDPERLRRWRMVLGAADDTGEGADPGSGPPESVVRLEARS